MIIKFVEISNFRKLLAVRIDLSEQTTVFVGANNSGKTSAMIAMRRFLTGDSSRFDINDFTLSHWDHINEIGKSWIDQRAPVKTWSDLVPCVDLWLQVESTELHFVRDLIPSLRFKGGLLGVRLSFEPKDESKLRAKFVESYENAKLLKQKDAEENENRPTRRKEDSLRLWPENLVDFLAKNLRSYFVFHVYGLDPTKLVSPDGVKAFPQKLPAESMAMDGDPLKGLIRVDEIAAQRGFGEPINEKAQLAQSNRLSDQLRSYYTNHLDPSDHPEIEDLGALRAIEAAQNAFDKRLMSSFKEAFLEVETMGYPGLTDPTLNISTLLKPVEGMRHASAVSFIVDYSDGSGQTPPLMFLPEGNNGLGYQNLISMIFKLMSFRDGWLRVKKASRDSSTDGHIEPLHLVLIEEPEAHLHAQVQQVFVEKAYDILREHRDLRNDSKLRTQLVISTHSSHVAHATPFSNLRYFRRLPAGMCEKVPVSSVVSLAQTFGTNDDTARFVKRYLRAHHSDLFFADAVILVEGSAERMLIPNFIKTSFANLNRAYISILEIGGSHAHRLEPLINTLRLLTLVITDLDAAKDRKKEVPEIGRGQVTSNSTLKKWLPQLEDIDKLLEAQTEQKIKVEDELFSIRVAYQMSVKLDSNEIILPYTFEDAFAFTNKQLLINMEGGPLLGSIQEAMRSNSTMKDAQAEIFKALKTGKAELALDVLQCDHFDQLKLPEYINEGLLWLQEKLNKKLINVLPDTQDTQ